MREYTTADIANIVGIAKPTVNKYSLVLERAGYLITRNDKGNRIYTDKDIQMLIKMKEKSNELKMPLAQIAKMLLTEKRQHNTSHDTIQKDAKTTVLDSTTLKQNEEESGNTIQIPDEFKHLLHSEFASMRESLRAELAQDFRSILEEKFEFFEREQERYAIKAANEAQKQIAAAEERQKRSFWKRLFRIE